jgi:mannosylglycerate hydrolase
MQNFVDLSDGEQGFAILTDSMLEYEALPGEKGTLALTLFRAVRNIICTEMRSAGVFAHEDGGQLLQKLQYRYAICLHDGDYAQGELFRKTDRLNVPVLPVQTSRQLRCGSKPTTASFYRVPEGLQMSCLKKADDKNGWILRLYNPNAETVCGDVTMPAAMASVEEVRLDETGSKAITCQGCCFQAEVGPSKIATYRIHFQKEEQ